MDQNQKQQRGNRQFQRNRQSDENDDGIAYEVADDRHEAAKKRDRNQQRRVRQMHRDKENRGQITRIGDKRLRSKLIQCAWTAIRKDPELRAFYRRIYERHPKKVAARKAIVAVARKLTTRIYAVLKEQRRFEIRTDILTAPLTAEETAGLRERLDSAQNDQP